MLMLDDYEDKDEGDDADDGPKDLPSRRHGAPSNVERILDFISVRKPFSKQHPLMQNSVGEGGYKPPPLLAGAIAAAVLLWNDVAGTTSTNSTTATMITFTTDTNKPTTSHGLEGSRVCGATTLAGGSVFAGAWSTVCSMHWGCAWHELCYSLKT